MSLFTKKLFFIPAISILAILSGCEVINPEESVPAYVHIDKITLTTSMGEGTASSNICDAWVYLDDQFIGAFELPVTFPVLFTGTHQITVKPGIKLNGISTMRVDYPFYKPVKKTVNLVENQTTEVTCSTTYVDNAQFEWIEDFEAEGISMTKTAKSDTSIGKTSDPDKLFEGFFSGIVDMSSDMDYFECATLNEYELPRLSSPVFLELNFKTNVNVMVGVFADSPTNVIQEAVVGLNHASEWKKIYLNLTQTVSSYGSTYKFKIYFAIAKEEGVLNPEFLADNIKLIHF